MAQRKFNIINGYTVGEATTGIRVAAVKWWRHYEQVNSLYRYKV